MTNYAEALVKARVIDPEADHADGAPDCLLISNEHAEAVLALFPGAYQDDNDPPTKWTRIVLPEQPFPSWTPMSHPYREGDLF